MAKTLDPAIEKAAPRLAEATPKTGSMVMTIFRSMILPMLGPALGELLKAKDAKKKYSKYLIPARNILNDADLGDA